jgi:hypothetical protein
LEGMNLHTLASEIKQVKTTLGESKNDVRILQDWCQESFDDLESRTAAGFVNCEEKFEDVKAGIDKIKEEQKGQRKESQRQAEDLKALKEALEELKGSGRGGDRAPTPRSTSGAPAADFQKKIKIGGWSPYGSSTQSRISAQEATELQKKITGMCTWAQKLAWRWDRPWLTNYQMIINVDGASSINDVFNAKAEIQDILDNKQVTIKGYKIEARVEQTQERKKLLSIFFNNVRAIEKATGTHAVKDGKTWHLELRTFSIYHLDYPDEPFGKLCKETMLFSYDPTVLGKLKYKEEDIRDELV